MEETLEPDLGFKTDGDAEVILFAQIVLTRTDKVPAYDVVATFVADVKVKLADFIKAVSDAINGGEELLKARDDKRGFLNGSLENLGFAIISADPDPIYLTNAGYKARKKTGNQNRQPFVAPFIGQLVRGALRGTVKGEVKSLPKGAYGVIPAWRIKSAPNAPFIDGNPSTGKRFELTGLPPLTEIEVAVRYYGTHGRTSDLSKPVTIDVL